MQIPKTLTLGNTRYSVVQVPKQPYSRLGYIDYGTCTITLSTERFGRPRPARGLATTFWHEVVHGILWDMDRHTLNGDEGFVDGFAWRLEKLVRTAKF